MFTVHHCQISNSFEFDSSWLLKLPPKVPKNDSEIPWAMVPKELQPFGPKETKTWYSKINVSFYDVWFAMRSINPTCIKAIISQL